MLDGGLITQPRKEEADENIADEHHHQHQRQLQIAGMGGILLIPDDPDQIDQPGDESDRKGSFPEGRQRHVDVQPMALQGGNQGAHFLRENGGISQQNHRQGKDEGPQSGCAVKIIDQDKSQYDSKGQKRSKLKHAAGDGTAADEKAADDEHHLDGGTDYAQYDAG